MTFFKRWNNLVGWAVFAVAAIVYLMTMEPVSSLWDCSEFIATSYKLEVGHPPGAPLFMMLARLATLFAFGNPDYVGIAVNAMNSLASAFCILFHIPCRHALIRIRCRIGGFARLHRQASAREVQQHVHAAGSIVDDSAADAQQIPVFIRRHPAAGG